MLETLCQPTQEVIAAIESLRPAVQPTAKPLSIADCTTPELRLEYIAQWLEAGAPSRNGIDEFNMGLYKQRTECGTVCCIAGAALNFFSPEYESIPAPCAEQAAEVLGIRNRDRLFIPRHWMDAPEIYTPAWAARCIRKYQREGIVDWEGTR